MLKRSNEAKGIQVVIGSKLKFVEYLSDTVNKV